MAKLLDNKDDIDYDHSVEPVEDVAPYHGSQAIYETREAYGPPGFRGLFSSPYVALCAAFSALGGLLFGYDQGVVSVILVMTQFTDRFHRVAEDVPNNGFWKGLLTAMLQLGAFVGMIRCVPPIEVMSVQLTHEIGALNQGWIADKYSRKYSIIIAVVVFTIGTTLQVASVNYAMLTIARTIGGIGIGQLSMVAPLYISEISPPEIRGALLVLEEFSIVLGIIIAYWITYGTMYIPSEWSWRLPFLLQLLPGFVLGGGIYFLPFSPRWLALKSRDDECLTSLSRLRRVPKTDHRIRLEWFDIKAEVAVQREALCERHPKLFLNEKTSTYAKREIVGWGDLFRKNCWRRTMVGMGIMFFQQFVGINALIYYSPSLFQQLGQGPSLRLILAGVLNVAQLVGVSTSLWTVDYFGRKPLLLLGSVCMTLSQLVIAIMVGLYGNDWSTHAAAGWVAVGFLFFYMVSFGATWGPVAWILPAEVFPTSLRAKGVAISTSTIWLMNFVIGWITPPMIENTGFGTYVFFAVFAALSFVWTWIFVKETKGRTLEQLDHVFGDASAETDMRRRKVIEQRLARELNERP